MDELRDAAYLIGINLAPAAKTDRFEVVEGNSNHMPMFEDRSFDMVLCNAILGTISDSG
jgi:ubiquinone/menaquinone biosynthesis C-methylase UbiE